MSTPCSLYHITDIQLKFKQKHFNCEFEGKPEKLNPQQNILCMIIDVMLNRIMYKNMIVFCNHRKIYLNYSDSFLDELQLFILIATKSVYSCYRLYLIRLIQV